MNKYKVWFTYTLPGIGYSEDYLITEAETGLQAWEKVTKANEYMEYFEVQSVEALD